MKKVVLLLTFLTLCGCQPGGVTDFDGDGASDQVDCDPADPEVYPGAPDPLGDGIDQDCDGADGSGGLDNVDDDGDGYSEATGDCDDADPTSFPGNAELCDGNDNDCDPSTSFAGGEEDRDSDTYPGCNDCDDEEPLTFPGATELCDGDDNDCDGTATGEGDEDGDGALGCDDCDDADSANFPGNAEVCDGQDNDCDPSTAAGGDESDTDGDSSATCADCDDADAANFPGNVEVCDGQDNDCDPTTAAGGDESDADGDLSLACADCDDGDSTNFPGNAEVCDGQDNDCDPTTAAGGYEGDTDGDLSLACDDCDDADAANFPGNVEVCDGQDNDCDPATVAGGDEGDTDGDLSLACDDCDDADSANFPGNVEVCDGQDNDCDPATAAGGDEGDTDGDLSLACDDCDDDDPTVEELDVDVDGFSTCDGDCDDAAGGTFPGATDDTIDGTDQNCDGVDGIDGDGDGFVDAAAGGDDCDDAEPTTYPNAAELCDGFDQDCDTDLDEDFDLDEDGFFDSSEPDCVNYYGTVVGVGLDCDDADDQSTTTLEDGDCDGTVAQDDCDDTDPTLSLSITLDSDCDGSIDCLAPLSAQGIPFVKVCGGSFDMGCTPSQQAYGQCTPSESPVHSVTLPTDFMMGVTEVTQAQWVDLTTTIPSWNPQPTLDYPVESISWFEALDFANTLSSAEGLPECYTLSSCTGVFGSGCAPLDTQCSGFACAAVSINSTTGSPYDCEGYRLPTEAEWEYAARAGTDYLFAGDDVLDNVAWTLASMGGSGGSSSRPVATRAPNDWDIYGMSGNVFEWVWDWFDSGYYSVSPSVSPAGPATGTTRVCRGGHMSLISPQDSRVSCRDAVQYTPDERSAILGLRLVRSLP